jgi:hypothetical protein
MRDAEALRALAGDPVRRRRNGAGRATAGEEFLTGQAGAEYLACYCDQSGRKKEQHETNAGCDGGAADAAYGCRCWCLAMVAVRAALGRPIFLCRNGGKGRTDIPAGETAHQREGDGPDAER